MRIPHDGKGPGGMAWVKRDELGEGTAKLLLQAFNFKTDTANDDGSQERPFFFNATLLLSGPKSYTLNETVSILSSASLPSSSSHEPVKIEEVSIDEYASQRIVQNSLDYGGGAVWPVLWATAFEGIRQGEAGVVTGTLESVLGRKCESFEVTIGEMVREGRREEERK